MMRKLFATLLLAAVCMGAVAQTNPANELLQDSKWNVALQAGFMYNYNMTEFDGMKKSGFGLEIAPIVLQYQAWKGGSLTFGLLDMFFDFQYLSYGLRFDRLANIEPCENGKGHIADLTFSFPVGFNQQFNEDWGLSLTAAAGIGIVNYVSKYTQDGYQHSDTFHNKANRVGFRLDIKANIWYDDFGVVVRYRPIAAKNNPYGSPILSGGVAFRF